MTDGYQPDRNDPMDQLVRDARRQKEAFGLLFDQFYPCVFAYCVRRLLLRAVAEDVCSEVFLKVAGRIHDFAGNTVEDFRRWLFRIATNEINAHLRKSLTRQKLLEAAARMGVIKANIAAPIMGDESPVQWKALYQALADLSDREQSIIALRFFAGLKHDQIAAALELKGGTVRVALSRALDKLRERLRPSANADSGPGISGRGY